MEGLEDLANALDAARQLVAGAQEARRIAARADTRWRAGEQQVARQQWRDRRDVGDQLGDGEDHRGARLGLDRLAVQNALELDVARTELVGRHKPRSGRAEAGKRFAETELRRRAAALNVARRQVL